MSLPHLTRGYPAPYPSHTVLGMPALSPTMTQGNVEKYLVKVGDPIAAGDRIAEVETDKATVDFDVVDDGIVAKFLIPEGAQDVQVGTPMIVLCEEAGDVAAFADFEPKAPGSIAEAAPPPTESAPAPVAAPPPPVLGAASAAGKGASLAVTAWGRWTVTVA